MTSLSSRVALEVADIFRAHAQEYVRQHPISPEQGRVLRHLTACPTVALGGHIDSCSGCGFLRISYNSCRDRHCPKCQASRRAKWLHERLERLLPIPYFHVVFTLPEQRKPLILHNQQLLYSLLFDSASATITTLAKDPKRLGAQVGLSAILHTWGQNLLFHPHLHWVVTGGGLSLDGQRWIPGSGRYFLPVKVLAKLFRGKFLAGLKALYRAGKLSRIGSVAALQSTKVFQQLIDACYARSGVVYAKRPFGSAERVFRYLGRYSHRVALSNQRLVALTEGKVSFEWKDDADGHRRKVMTVSAEEFIRRFLLHVLPKGLVRIGHYGLLASINAKSKLEHCRELLGEKRKTPPLPPKTGVELVLEQFGFHPLVCPYCQSELIRRPVSSSEQSKQTQTVGSNPTNQANTS
jgi:hypothetical protein